RRRRRSRRHQQDPTAAPRRVRLSELLPVEAAVPTRRHEATSLRRLRLMPYRSIVVGTDGSDTAERAVRQAGQMAADHHARLVVITAYEPNDELSTQRDGVPEDIRWALTDRVQAEEKAQHGRGIARHLGVAGVVAQAIPVRPPG